MEWMIASDSSCEIRTLPDTAPGVQFALVPFKIRVGEREFVDLPTLNTKAMLQAMTDYNGASATACPSPEEWAELFLMADKSIALTISHNLSGSYNAALTAREMVLEEHPEKQIFVLDTLSCSGALAGAAELANKLIRIGTNFDTICIELANWAQKGHIMFALASFDNLAKAGRVSRVVGFIAGRLNMRVWAAAPKMAQSTFSLRRSGRSGGCLAKDFGTDGRGRLRWCAPGADQRVQQPERRQPVGTRHPRQMAGCAGGYCALQRSVQLLLHRTRA